MLKGLIVVGDDWQRLVGAIQSLQRVGVEVHIYSNGGIEAGLIGTSLGCGVMRGENMGYARNRTHLMKSVCVAGDWVIQLDSDERYVAGLKGASFKDALGIGGIKSYLVRLINPVPLRVGGGVTGVTEDLVTRIFRYEGWMQYEGTVHERIKDLAGESVWGFGYISHIGYDLSWLVYKEKLHRNLQLLIAGYGLGEAGAQELYHLGQTLGGLGLWAGSFSAYRESLRLGGGNLKMKERSLVACAIYSSEALRGRYYKGLKELGLERILSAADISNVRKELGISGEIEEIEVAQAIAEAEVYLRKLDIDI